MANNKKKKKKKKKKKERSSVSRSVCVCVCVRVQLCEVNDDICTYLLCSSEFQKHTKQL